MGDGRSIEQIESFNSGDIFLIKDLDCPDYWWEKTDNATTFSLLRQNYPQEIIVPGYGAARILETQKTDLNSYLELDKGKSNAGGTGDLDLSNYKLRVAHEGDTGLENYITFILEE